MRDYIQALRFAISSEAKAYGFTLVIWSTGTLEIIESGGKASRADVFGFLGGALVGMALIVALTFRRPLATWTEREAWRYAFGVVHLASVLAAALAAWGVTSILNGVTAYFAGPLVAVVVFQLLLAAEILASTAGYKQDQTGKMTGEDQSNH